MIHTYSWEYPRPLSPFTHLLSIYLIYFGIKSFKFNLNKIKCKEQGYDKLGLVSTCLEVQDNPCKLSNSCKMLQGKKNIFLARFDKHLQENIFAFKAIYFIFILDQIFCPTNTWQSQGISGGDWEQSARGFTLEISQ